MTRRPLQLCQIWCKYANGGFWANGWNITNLSFISNPSTYFHAWWLKRRRIAQRWAFGGFVDISSQFCGWNFPKKKNNFESLTRLFQAKLAKYWEFHIVETAAPISTEMAYIVSDGALKSSQTKPLVPYSGSTVKISNTWKTKMAVAAMLKITKKSRFIRCGLKHFKHSKMADGRHFENR